MKLLTLRVEPHDGTKEENARDAIRLAMKLNVKIIFSFDNEEIIADPLKDQMEVTDASSIFVPFSFSTKKK